MIVMVRYRINVAQERLFAAQQSLGIAADDLRRLKDCVQSGNGRDSVHEGPRGILFGWAATGGRGVSESARSQEAMKAEALLGQGDLNFEMANTPELPGAATQPALRLADPEDSLLSNASDAYSQILQNYSTSEIRGDGRAFRSGGDCGKPGGRRRRVGRFAMGCRQDSISGHSRQRRRGGVQDDGNSEIGILPQLSKPAAMGLTATTRPATLQAFPLAPTTQKY